MTQLLFKKSEPFPSFNSSHFGVPKKEEKEKEKKCIICQYYIMMDWKLEVLQISEEF